LPDIRRLAERLTAGARSTRDQAARLQRFVQQRVTFTKEAVETFSPTWRTLEHGLGDCDDSSRALLALTRSLGMDTALQTIPELGSAKAPSHVAPVLTDGGEQFWLEPSIAARFGEHPQRAARRLKSSRSELGGLGAVDPEAKIEISLTTEQRVLLSGSALSALVAMVAPQVAPAALAIGGGAAGYAATAFPFLRDFETEDGDTCSTWLPGVEEGDEKGIACEKRFGYLRARNAAIGAAAGALAGWLLLEVSS
jgi:hypothetical protein